jgi:hypothetical protein
VLVDSTIKMKKHSFSEYFLPILYLIAVKRGAIAIVEMSSIGTFCTALRGVIRLITTALVYDMF